MPLALSQPDRPDWPALPLAVVFTFGEPKTFYGKLVRRFAGSPTHCALYLGSEDCAFDSAAPVGVRLWPMGQDAMALMTGDQPYSVLTPPSIMEGDVAAAFARAMVWRGSRYDYLGAFCYWLPVTSRYRVTCSEYMAECVAHLAPRTIRHSGSPKQLLQALVAAGWRRHNYQ